MSYVAFRGGVVRNLEVIGATTADATKRAAILRRAWKMGQCATQVQIAVCDCGEEAEGTGKLVSLHPCGARACSYCARVKATERFHDLYARMEAIPKVDGYAFREVEITLKRNPRDQGAHTVEALAARADWVKAASKHVSQNYLARRDPEYAVRWACENAGSGNVHGHLTVYSRFIPKKELEAVLRQVKPPPGCSVGFTWVSRAREDVKGLAREHAKYATKSPSPMAESWLAGVPHEVMAPELAARWEVATMGKQLSGMFGAFRKVKLKPAEPDPEDDQGDGRAPPASCDYCGCIGSLAWQTRDAQSTIRAMHRKGRKALKGSRWKPREPAKGPEG